MQIHYVTGSRADFGLMERSLQKIAGSGRHDVGVVVTGQHLVDKYGTTAADIRASGLRIVGEVPVELTGQSGAEMGHALAAELSGFLSIWSENRPDLLLLLGDRGEMLAAAIAGVHLGIHVAHIGGGELTGTLDESFRHAITKLSHIHFPCTEEAADRILRMGERPETVHVIGAPGLVGIVRDARPDALTLKRQFGLSPNLPFALIVFHPVVQEARQAASQIENLLEAVQRSGHAALILRPNSDAGGEAIDAVLDSISQGPAFCVISHLERDTYLDLIEIADVMIGNSSSGIIESASFGTPCVNIGSRQAGRQRNANTFDCDAVEAAAILSTIRQASSWARDRTNVYGDGKTDVRLLQILDGLELSDDQLTKKMAY